MGREIGRDKAVGAHNTFLQVWLAFGVVGFSAFVAGIVSLLRSLWRQRALFWCRAVLVALAMTLVNGMALHLAYDKVFWLTMALSCSSAYLAWTAEAAVRRRALRAQLPAAGRLAHGWGSAAQRGGWS